MSEPYEEILNGSPLKRLLTGLRHELICDRLHERVQVSVANLSSTRLLSRRSETRLDSSNLVRPDLALLTTATGKLWLAAEIVSPDDHHSDTVVKKQIYEELKLPRLWMVDPRYDNIEIYHSTEYGLSMKEILSGRDVLTEKLLPGFQMPVAELFAPSR